MILLTVGAETLARLMASDGEAPDTAWLLHGPEELAVADEPEAFDLAAE